MNPNVVIVLASLNQENPFRGILGQALSQHATCATGADDDEIVGVWIACCTHVSTFIDIHF
jgi:hypothetical protein